jgi:hypothetical protein
LIALCLCTRLSDPRRRKVVYIVRTDPRARRGDWKKGRKVMGA